jgi:transposase InsO family protein
MNADEKADLIRKVDLFEGSREKVLKSLKIKRSTFYKWRRVYDEYGVEGLTKLKAGAKRIWNKLTDAETKEILKVARNHPELSPRLLSVKITDEGRFFVSESTVFKVLKDNGLVNPRPMPEMPAAREWRKKTTRPDEIWQCDGTNLFIVGWGYYKLIPVEDDYSRKILGYDLKPDESAFSITDAVEIAIENSKKEGHLSEEGVMPALYSDNGSGFASKVMSGYLGIHGIRHIFGTPYHPQGRGKIERFNRRIKETLCLVVYQSPEELKRSIDEAIRVYNQTPHESLKNVSPSDVYAGRKEEILQKREEKKRLTFERRKQYNLNQKPAQDQGQSANLVPRNLSINC